MQTAASSPTLEIDVDAAEAPAFGISEDRPPFRSHFHHHARHQILYAERGLLHLDVESGSWTLPPHRAAFLTAGTAHRVTAEREVSLRTVYIVPDWAPPLGWDCRVFTVGPLAKELLLYAMRWSALQAEVTRLQKSYFVTLMELCIEWSERDALPFRLPVPQSAELRRATEFLRDRLGQPIGIPDLARAAAMSPRTLRRHFEAELGMTPRAYLHAARLLAALERLTDPSIAITTVALEVGFETPSSFSHAFTAFVGESPRQYQKRLRDS